MDNLCRVLEGAWEVAQTAYMCFVDLEEGFNRVRRGSLWGALQRSLSQWPFTRGYPVSDSRAGVWSALPVLSWTLPDACWTLTGLPSVICPVNNLYGQDSQAQPRARGALVCEPGDLVFFLY